MKRFRLGYSLFVLMLMSLFSKNVNLYADISSERVVTLGVNRNPAILSKAGYMMEQVQRNVLAGNYFELVVGAIAVCILILFTMELLESERKGN